MMFTGKNGSKPSTEARRYVYSVMASALAEDLKDDNGWIFGGMDDEFDRRRAKQAAKKVYAELVRKATPKGGAAR